MHGKGQFLPPLFVFLFEVSILLAAALLFFSLCLLSPIITPNNYRVNNLNEKNFFTKVCQLQSLRLALNGNFEVDMPPT